ncbi:hypothetical protein PG988_007428 [Apiospora saccharicola]
MVLARIIAAQKQTLTKLDTIYKSLKRDLWHLEEKRSDCHESRLAQPVLGIPQRPRPEVFYWLCALQSHYGKEHVRTSAHARDTKKHADRPYWRPLASSSHHAETARAFEEEIHGEKQALKLDAARVDDHCLEKGIADATLSVVSHPNYASDKVDALLATPSHGFTAIYSKNKEAWYHLSHALAAASSGTAFGRVSKAFNKNDGKLSLRYGNQEHDIKPTPNSCEYDLFFANPAESASKAQKLPHPTMSIFKHKKPILPVQSMISVKKVVKDKGGKTTKVLPSGKNAPRRRVSRETFSFAFSRRRVCRVEAEEPFHEAKRLGKTYVNDDPDYLEKFVVLALAPKQKDQEAVFESLATWTAHQPTTRSAASGF